MAVGQVGFKDQKKVRSPSLSGPILTAQKGQAHPRRPAREPHRQPAQQDQGRKAPGPAAGAPRPRQGAPRARAGGSPGAAEGGGAGRARAQGEGLAARPRVRRPLHGRERRGREQRGREPQLRGGLHVVFSFSLSNVEPVGAIGQRRESPMVSLSMRSVK
jgi:hypothetical protein